MTRHISTCPALRDPTAKCFCPPPGHPGTRYTTDTPRPAPAAADGEFALTPPEPVAEASGAIVNRSGESRGQVQTRLRRIRSTAMVKKYGPGPAGMTCSTCAFLERRGSPSRAYSKCTKYGVSHSEATDWSQRWAACALYQSR